MRIRLDHSTRLISGITLATLLSVPLAACSPVVLQADTDSGTGDSTGGANTDGDSNGSTGAGEGEDDGGGEGVVPGACVDLEPRVLGILETNCAKCHGPGPTALVFDYILNLPELINTGKITPQDAEGSKVYARMTAMTAPMPPLEETQRPSVNDIDIVGAWIDQCAGKGNCEDQPFIGRSQMLNAINADLNTVNLQSLPFTRYFTFVHLYNAGWCDAEIEPFRQALSKLVNSLSHGPLIKAPVAIDKERLIFRVDIADYKWEQRADEKTFKLSEPSFHFRDKDPFNNSPDSPNANPEEQIELAKEYRDIWEMMADQNPYTVEYLGDVASNIKKQTNTNFPVITGDAFIDTSSRSPLYYDILGIPKRSAQLRAEDPPCGAKGTPEECLETQLEVNVLAEIENEFAQDKDLTGRAGFKSSDVSEFNRVVERHLIANDNNRVFWISYDFGGQVELQNIMVHPLDFDFDGGEIIWSLENGLQAYKLTNAAGDRLNEGPSQIVQDPSQKDKLVRNGVSCMGCHIAGMIKVNDDVRFSLDANGSTLFTEATKDKIRDLYPRREEFALLQQEDINRFNSGLTKAGVATGGKKEPVVTTFLQFDEDLGLRRVGAEYDLSSNELLANIGKLGNDLADLTQPNATIQRADFSTNFRDGACTLLLGCTRSCPGIDDPNEGRTCDFDGNGGGSGNP